MSRSETTLLISNRICYGLVISITNNWRFSIFEIISGNDEIMYLSLEILDKLINSIPLFMKGTLIKYLI